MGRKVVMNAEGAEPGSSEIEAHADVELHPAAVITLSDKELEQAIYAGDLSEPMLAELFWRIKSAMVRKDDMVRNLPNAWVHQAAVYLNRRNAGLPVIGNMMTNASRQHWQKAVLVAIAERLNPDRMKDNNHG